MELEPQLAPTKVKFAIEENKNPKLITNYSDNIFDDIQSSGKDLCGRVSVEDRSIPTCTQDAQDSIDDSHLVKQSNSNDEKTGEKSTIANDINNLQSVIYNLAKTSTNEPIKSTNDEWKKIEDKFKSIEKEIKNLETFKNYHKMSQKFLEVLKNLNQLIKMIKLNTSTLCSEQLDPLLENFSKLSSLFSSVAGPAKLLFTFAELPNYMIISSLESSLKEAIELIKEQDSSDVILNQCRDQIESIHIILSSKSADSRRKIRNGFVSFLKYCSSWLKVFETSQITFVTSIKCALDALKHAFSVAEQDKNLKLIKKRNFKTTPLCVVSDSTAQAFNGLMEELKTAQDLAALEAKLKEKKINSSFGIATFDSLHEGLRNDEVQHRLLNAFLKRSEPLGFNYYTSSMIDRQLKHESEKHESMKQSALLMISQLINLIESVEDFERIQEVFLSFSLNLHHIDPSIHSIDDWNQKKMDPIFQSKLANAYIQHQETWTKMLEQALRISISKKNSLDAKSIKLNMGEALCYMVSEIISGVLALPGIVSIPLFTALIGSIFVEFSLTTAFVLSWLFPALVPSMVGCAIMLVILVGCYLNKPNEYGVEGQLLSLQRSLVDQFYSLQVLLNTMAHWGVFLSAAAVNAVWSKFFSDADFFKSALDGIVREEKNISDNRKSSLRSIDVKLNSLKLRDLNLCPKAMKSEGSSIGTKIERIDSISGNDSFLTDREEIQDQSELDTAPIDLFEEIRKFGSNTRPEFLPKRFMDFLNKEMGIEVSKESLSDVSDDIKNFFCLSPEKLIEIYQKQIWRDELKKSIGSVALA